MPCLWFYFPWWHLWVNVVSVETLWHVTCMFELQCLIHPCPQFTHMHSLDQWSQISQFCHRTAASLPCSRSGDFICDILFIQGSSVHILYALDMQNLSTRASCLVKVRKVEVKTSNFGSAIVLVWLCPYREVSAPLALPPCHPQNQGRLHPALTVTCSFLFWKQKQTLVSADIDSIAT